MAKGPYRTIVYVDGFNFYYGEVRGTPWKWLDPVALFRKVLGPRGIRPPETGLASALFTHSGSWGDISCIARRQTGTRERENGQIVRCNAAWGG